MRTILAYTFCITLAFSAVAAQTPSTASALQRTKNNYQNASTFEAHFEFSMFWSIREKEEKKSGHIYLGPGEKFSVTLGKEMFVCDGTTYWQYDGRTGQVTIKNMNQLDLSSHPSQLIQTYLTSYPFKETGKDAGAVVYSWARKKSQSTAQYDSIRIWIDSAKFTLKKIRAVDENENIQTYTFGKITYNGKIPSEVFAFEMPENARIVDLRP